MRRPNQSSIVLAAFVTTVALVAGAWNQSSAERPATTLANRALAVRDSADTSQCLTGWSNVNGIIVCDDDGH